MKLEDIAAIGADTPGELETIERAGIEMPPDAPVERGKVLFVSADGGFASGVWQGEAGTIPISGYPVDENCQLIEGEVTLIDEYGAARTFSAGDTFVVPCGFKGSWHMPVRSTKIFACHGDPRAIALMTGSG